jgi:competence protein ComEC
MRFYSHKTRSALLITGVFLLAANGLLWRLVLVPAEQSLQVSFLDIGQGDSILIEGPTGIDMLVDGGPDRSVVRRLPRELGLLDRSIDLLVATHPDKDHIAGLTDVLGRYRVGVILAPGIKKDSSDALAFNEAARSEPGAVELRARRGMRINLGGGAYADVLYPDRDVTDIETNSGSVVLHVVYGSTSFMLTGDAPVSVEAYLRQLDPDASGLRSTVLKAGHHGSRTSTDVAWLEAVDPQIVAISAGRDNQYGHPHAEVVEAISASGAQMVSTAESGTLRFVSDGTNVWLR